MEAMNDTRDKDDSGVGSDARENVDNSRNGGDQQNQQPQGAMEQPSHSTPAEGENNDDNNNNNDNNSQSQIQKKRKRKDKKIDYYANAYENVRFTPIVADIQPLDKIAGVDHTIYATTPGSPSRLFKNSYRVSFVDKETKVDINAADEKTIADSSSTSSSPSQVLSQIIHQHANGLCIVTIGDGAKSLLSKKNAIMERIEFLATTAEACSAGARRKRQSDMLRKGSSSAKGNNSSNQKKPKKNDKIEADNTDRNNDKSKRVHDSNDNSSIKNNSDGVVTPSTVLAKIHCRMVDEGQQQQQQQEEEHATMVLPIYAGVWGSLLELHTSLTSTQLTQDPLLDGYVAIILPTGPFPPKECLI